MKRRYELTVILSPQLSSKDLAKKEKAIETLIKKQEGKLVKKDDWGTKDLAFAIDKQTEGKYRYYELELPGKALAVLDGEFKLVEGMLRYLFVRSEK